MVLTRIPCASKGLKTLRNMVDICTEDNTGGAKIADIAEEDKMTLTKSTYCSGANIQVGEGATDIRKILCFKLAGEEFAINVLDVEETVHHKEIMQQSGMPNFAYGVIHVRGKTIPVIDLRNCFDLERRSGKESFQFVIVNIADQKVGLVVDSVTGVQRMSKDAIQPVSDVALPLGCKCISGILGEDDQYTLMIDLSCLLTSHQLTELGGCCRE
ncbi:MAG: chemotaxis protein CheW [candidate division Zixibacteria bacterium]|nr:chemotaxis protein CheW [candidate division Zixibacteria bacterium]MBU1469994.1 chemotaxis protein CheW [candidate division Zixibacteria bacterium]MBU2626174.1 chemotaxis protein CheW [candidate division Zixibacteria bacterium]